MTPPELFIVMPVYNEEASISRVIHEWVPVLREQVKSFVLCVMNDGSKDRTLEILRALEAKIPELKIVDKPNSGHGQTCIKGYGLALASGAQWVFQIDSDGQCDPRYFPALWQARLQHPVVYGFRSKREDGYQRFLISRVVSVVTLLGARVWVRDANAPYRLMRSDTLLGLTENVPADFHLANIYVAALQQDRFGIHWIDIGFRQRFGGTPSVKAYSFGKQGVKLFKQLQAARRPFLLPALEAESKPHQ